jgi:hypothetical protein
MKRIAAILFAVMSLGVVVFQIALALGAPWGEYAMGGAFPGQYPPALRFGAVIQAVLLAGFAAVVLARAGLIQVRWLQRARGLVWVVVVLFAVFLVLNLISPSAEERALWVPVILLLWISSLIVALAKPT